MKRRLYAPLRFTTRRLVTSKTKVILFMIVIAVIVTFVLTTVLSMAGVEAAFVLIQVFLALGVKGATEQLSWRLI